MTTKCLIIDDEPLAVDLLKSYVTKISSLQLAGIATDPLKGLEMVQETGADLVFLDIQMDEMSGIEFAGLVGKRTKIVFCTAYSQHAVASFNLDAVDYLLKPITFERFQRAVQRAQGQPIVTPSKLAEEKEPAQDYLFLKTERKGKMIKLEMEQIDFIKAKNNYVAFHTNGQIIVSHYSMNELVMILPKDSFIRVHKSYIVNIKKIVSLEHGELKMAQYLDPIPLSANFKKAFLQQVNKRVLN